MKTVKVEYTVRPAYVDQNKEWLRQVMAYLKDNPIEGLYYTTYTLQDGQTFVHINMAKDPSAMAQLNEVPVFQAFRKALMESELIAPPQETKLDFVAAGFDL